MLELLLTGGSDVWVPPKINVRKISGTLLYQEIYPTQVRTVRGTAVIEQVFPAHIRKITGVVVFDPNDV